MKFGRSFFVHVKRQHTAEGFATIKHWNYFLTTVGKKVCCTDPFVSGIIESEERDEIEKHEHFFEKNLFN